MRVSLGGKRLRPTERAKDRIRPALMTARRQALGVAGRRCELHRVARAEPSTRRARS